ncbi:MAG: thiamine phosphate synthase [Sediminimonas qiaohouensis]|uniref:Thiamine phosphate synthase n=1 Tax=Sediminimonas qiaohouensis TaxID=552061 RepID=A0A7C9HAV7_9RHOB|nr:thiamine phosphate synthase [Sediminimonas qiaohouensis]MTJ03607.1 thiamine phosphate synthase [Sediminimonas qiaohouensis]
MAQTDTDTAPEAPQIYLITPPQIDLNTFPDLLARMLDTHEIACLRLALSSADEDHIARAGDALREVAHARDVAIVIDTHLLMVERLGLDGVHLPDNARSVRKSRKELGNEAIVGAFCGASRHDGLNAGEAGADYIAFGPIGQTPLGDGTCAEADLFDWWSQVVELPVVAEGALDAELIRALAPITDFFALGAEVWQNDDPIAELGRLIAAME